MDFQKGFLLAVSSQTGSRKARHQGCSHIRLGPKYADTIFYTTPRNRTPDSQGQKPPHTKMTVHNVTGGYCIPINRP